MQELEEIIKKYFDKNQEGIKEANREKWEDVKSDPIWPTVLGMVKEAYNKGVADSAKNARWKHQGLYKKDAEGVWINDKNLKVDKQSILKLLIP